MPPAEEIRPEVGALPCGLRVVTTPLPAAQGVSASFFVGVGSRSEDRRTNGVSHYLEHMLFKGTETRPTAAGISEAIEGAGGALNAYTTRELTCYWNTLPHERAGTGVEVLADMVRRSLLDEDELERERGVVQQEIRRGRDAPSARAGELMAAAVYGDQPIGWPVTGTPESVAGLVRGDFVAHAERFYGAENAVLSVAGAVEHGWVMETAERWFGGLPAGAAAEPAPARRGLPAERVIVEEREIEQTNLALALQALPRRDPARYALALLHTVLGRGMSSRLFREVRERRGLAYSIASGVARHRDIGVFSVTAGVTRDRQEEALAVIAAELRRTAAEPIPGPELQRAKDFAAGSFRLSLETPGALGQLFGEQLLRDGELEPPAETVARLRAVGADEVQALARRLFEGRAFALAVVGPSAPADRLDAILAA